MSWLKEQKKKFDAEEAEKEAQKKKKEDILASWYEAADLELKGFVKDKLGDVIGKETKDGKKISVKWMDNLVILMAGEESLMDLHFGVDEHEECDSDGCKWGNGKYYVRKQVKYNREFKFKRYDTEEGGPDSYYKVCMTIMLLSIY